ncbi:MAG: CPBP family intramembrane metalloprotease [Alistipes sp.]|nr:CPBP family intramembrane metalloprotease [Alistipes sp.]
MNNSTTDKTAAAVRRSSFPAWYDFLVLALLFIASQAVLLAVSRCCGLSNEIIQTIHSADEAPAELAWDQVQSLDAARHTAARATAAGYAAGMSLMIVLTLIYRRLRGSHARTARISVRGLDPWLILKGMVVIAAASIVTEPLMRLLPGAPDYSLIGHGGWALLSTVVCAPLLEEFLFRGIILESVRERYGAAAAWVIPALLFGAAHGLPPQILAAAVIGLILGDVCLRSGSLAGCMILHALNNAAALLMLTVTGSDDIAFRDMVSERAYPFVYAAAAAIFALWLTGAIRRVIVLRRAEKAAQ